MVSIVTKVIIVKIVIVVALGIMVFMIFMIIMVIRTDRTTRTHGTNKTDRTTRTHKTHKTDRITSTRDRQDRQVRDETGKTDLNLTFQGNFRNSCDVSNSEMLFRNLVDKKCFQGAWVLVIMVYKELLPWCFDSLASSLTYFLITCRQAFIRKFFCQGLNFSKKVRRSVQSTFFYQCGIF